MLELLDIMFLCGVADGGRYTRLIDTLTCAGFAPREICEALARLEEEQ